MKYIEHNYYHIYNRGIDGNPIFFNEDNYLYFIRLLNNNHKRYDISVLVYCLIPNHYHLLVYQNSEITSSRFMQSLNNAFVQGIHKQMTWVDITSVEWQYLDEGQHSVSLQSRYITRDTSSIVTRSFIVDAVDGPALMFFPRAHFVSSYTIITFQILAEEVTNLAALEFSINYEPDHVEITSVTKGAIFSASEESIFYTDYNNSTGTLSVLAATLGGDEPSMSGTVVLIEIQINIIFTGSSQLTFTGSEVFKDPENNEITINETVSGLVLVE